MIKLSDYLDYLNSEIIQARKAADENAVLVAKEYAKHSYLKYFKVPRYAMRTVKMDIPVKITDIDADSKYNFKYEPEVFLKDVNNKIIESNKTKDLKISLLEEKDLKNKDFQTLFKSLENKDQKYVKNFTTEIKKVDLSPQIKSLNLKVFKPQAEENEEANDALAKILSESISSRYNLVNSKLNNIYIDPNTGSSDDKDKLIINLHVEMEEEAIRIVTFTDKDGKEIEEITFD
ncbi:hypothetical protein [Polaribacter sp. L3A8]|uniref:hypothetical protein n=1 Tax=Polaribacter sp. L3A8 TaxID=2686361 RepID=UPI00131B7818|nr:hypothetical protein [Polaribacter sp. L3A8]